MTNEQTRAAGMMLAALRQWRCGSCGGRGTYHHNARETARKVYAGGDLDPQFNPPPVPCKACGGRGLNPLAQEAIAAAEAAGLIGP